MTEHNGLLDGFSKEKADQLASRYNSLSFLQKPANQLSIFYVVITLLSLSIMASSLGTQIYENIEIIGFMFGLFLYVFFAFFIFLNHRWAMILACLMYLFDKAVLVLAGHGAISQLLFGFFCLALSWRAVLVASRLKVLERTNVSAFD